MIKLNLFKYYDKFKPFNAKIESYRKSLYQYTFTKILDFDRYLGPKETWVALPSTHSFGNSTPTQSQKLQLLNTLCIPVRRFRSFPIIQATNSIIRGQHFLSFFPFNFLLFLIYLSLRSLPQSCPLFFILIFHSNVQLQCFLSPFLEHYFHLLGTGFQIISLAKLIIFYLFN